MDTNKLKELAEKLAPAYQQPWESHRHSASAVTVGAVGEDGEYSDFIDVRISDYWRSTSMMMSLVNGSPPPTPKPSSPCWTR